MNEGKRCGGGGCVIVTNETVCQSIAISWVSILFDYSLHWDWDVSYVGK